MLQLSKHSPVLRIEGNVTDSNNSDLVVSYLVELDEIYSLNEKTLDHRFDGLYSAIRTLPVGSIFYKQDFVLKERFSTSTWRKDNFITKNTASHFDGRLVNNHFCIVHIILNRKGSILKNNNVKNPFKPLPSAKQLNDSVEDNSSFLSNANRVVGYLKKSNGYKISPLTSTDLEDLAERYFNGLVSNKYTDSVNKSDYFQIGDRLLSGYCITSNKQFKEQELSNSIIDRDFSTKFVNFIKPISQDFLFTGQTDKIYNQFISVEDHMSIRRDIRQLKSDFEKAGSTTIDFDNTADNLKQLDTELATDSKIQFVRAHFSVFLVADSESELENGKDELETAFTTLAIKPYMPSDNMLSNVFYNSFYSLASNLDLDSSFTCDLQLALCLINYVTPTRSDESGVLFQSRLHNAPFKRDIWDEKKKRIKARNFMITAPTGEGKSDLAQHVLISQYFENEKNVIFICDLGNSFQKLAGLFPNEVVYIRYQQGKSLGINPFEWYGDTPPTNEFFDDLIGFLKIPYKRGEGLTEEEIVSLGKILKLYYEQFDQGHSFPHFYAFVNAGRENLLDHLEIAIDESRYFDLKQFLHNCSIFVEQGSLAFLFKTDDADHYNVQGKRFIVFEFDEAKENPILLSILLQLKDNIIQRLIWSDRSTKGIVFYDEVAKFFKMQGVFPSICYSAQTMRKYEAAIGMALQSPTNLPLEEEHKNNTAALLKNTQVFYCLQDSSGYNAHQEVFNFTEERMFLLKSVKSDFKADLPFSEFLLSIGDESFICRLELPKKVLLVYETEGRKHEQILKLCEELGSMEAAVESYYKQQ